MKQNKKVIVITGSIGTGKSTAVNIIKGFGFTVLDSDKIVHEGYEINSPLYNQVKDLFGEHILNDDRTINRQKLGSIVFNNNEKLDLLNEIVHAYVHNVLNDAINGSNDEVIFLDIPLILENIKRNKYYDLKFDEIWLIYINPETQIERLRKRAIQENKNPKDVLNIIKKQIPIDEKVSMVTEVIDNEGTIEELKIKIEELLKIKGIGW